MKAPVKRIGRVLAFLAALGGGNALADVRRVPEDYSRIQDAVNDAHPGDIILVGPGTYVEKVKITKSAIRLEAYPEQAAVLDGSGLTAEPAILLQGTDPDLGGSNVTGVSVVGFRIENQSGPGIRLMFTDHCQILSNSVHNTGAQSIVAMRSTSDLVANNTLSNGTRGVEMTMRSFENLVKENLIVG